MAEVDEDVVSELAQRGQNLLIGELVALLERHHASGEPGVSRETIDAYAEAVADDPDLDVDRAIDEQLTDAEGWAGNDALYDLGGRISAYPAAWHEELGGSTDVEAYLALVEEASTGERGESPDAGTSGGVSEEWLLDTMATIGRVERDEPKEALEDARAEGTVTEGPDQHPNAGVRLAEGSDRANGNT